MIVRIAGMTNDSIVDGPGIRFTVFTQGCPHRCEGCHNPSTHDFQAGREIDTEEIIAQLANNPLLSGITLSGGEPFCQAAACAELARGAKRLGLNVWVYTGYTFERLMEGAEEEGWQALLSACDVLVDGPFILAQRSLEVPWRGSKNQRLIDAPASLRARRCILHEYS